MFRAANMLIEFRFGNFRSIKDEQALSMSVGPGLNADDECPRKVVGSPRPLLPVAAIYGANASGKTSILAGLAYMQQAALYSYRAWSPEGGTTREPFMWDGMPNQPTMFEVTVVQDGVRYQYGFVLDNDRFIEEWLHVWPASRKQVWFERDGDNFKFGDALSGEKSRIVEQVTRPNALFLSAAVQNRHEQLRPLYSWFRDLAVVNVPMQPRAMVARVPVQMWLAAQLDDAGLFPSERAEEISVRHAFVEMLRAADVGIVDLKVEATGEEFAATAVRSMPNVRVLLRHRRNESDAWLPLEKESQGTATLFKYGREIIVTLRKGGTLIVDELERSLHPLLALWIVERFNSSKHNPKNAQLIFSTHDTNLLGTTLGTVALRRDQVWLTEKGPDGATSLYPLTDFKARKSENFERGYLQGRYGAIPVFGSFETVEE
jgi:uncharacterized protein